MKQVGIIATAATLAIGVSVSTALAAPGEKGIFETPMVDPGNGEVFGSESKIQSNGDYKVEIETGSGDTTYAVCLVAAAQGTLWLGDFMSDEDGELKAQGTLDPGTYQAPSFEVRDGSGDCAGNLVWASGLTIE
jgi:hypothetical protein